MATVISGGVEWDAAKAEGNLAKHGVSFLEATIALADPMSVVEADATNPENENALCYSPKGRCLFVVSTERGDRTRLISARRASRAEEASYYGD